MNDLKTSDRLAHRACCEPLEARRMLNAGELDLSFSGDGKATLAVPYSDSFQASDVAVQSDGKVIVVGTCFGGSLAGKMVVARYDAAGNLDPSFGESGTGLAYTDFSALSPGFVNTRAVKVQPDDKIVVVGFNSRSMLVARFTHSGVLDPSFSGDGKDAIDDIDGDYEDSVAYDVALQNDGKIVVAGSVSGILAGEEDSDMAVVRYNSNGTLDGSFNFNGKVNIGFGENEHALALSIDYTGSVATNPNYGKIILVGGQYSNSNASARTFALARLNTNGSLDSSFDGDGKRTIPFRPEYEYSQATGVVVQSDGKMVIAGEVGFSTSPTHNFGLMRLNPNGSSDFSFGQEVGKTEIDFGDYDFVGDVIIGQTGRLIVGGSNSSKMALACFSSEGILDTVFSGDGKQTISFGTKAAVYALALAPGGTIVAAGGEKFATARLFDRKGVTASIGSFDPNAFEAGQDIASFIVARLERLPTPQRIYINVSGTARAPYLLNADYTVSGMTIVHPITGRSYVDIAANSTFTTVTVTPVNDFLVEGDETVVFSISADQPYDIGTPPSTTLAIRDDDITGGPVVISSQFMYETLPQRARFTFNRDVSASIDASDFSVTGPSGPVPFGFSHDSITNTTLLSFDGILPNGNYEARATGAGIVSSLGTPMASDSVLSFFFQMGDADHDRDVDINDLGILASNWQQSPRTFSQGDFDYTGTVDIADLGILASHWQQQLAAPSMPFSLGRNPVAPKRIAADVLSG